MPNDALRNDALPRLLGSVLEEAVARLRRSGSESPRLDAEVLAAHVLGTDRTEVLAHPERRLSAGEAARYEECIVRRELGEPVAYVCGLKEFYGLAFSVDRRVLIPRPETELLVDLALAEIVSRLTGAPRPSDAPPLRVADVGTGSGAVAVALAVSLRRRGMAGDVDILGTDISPQALEVALENVVSHAVAEHVRLRRADLLPADELPFDLVAANLPYVPAAEMQSLPVALSYEPALALDGGPDGLEPLRALLQLLPGALRPGGKALLEIGSDQAARAHGAVAEGLPGWGVVVHRDLAGSPRVLEVVPR
jgi:release factor glutamine methyltransferase